MSIFAGESRASMRRRYLDAWRKFCAREALGSLEAQLAAVIAEHPEYVAWLESGEEALSAEFTPQRGRQNPFLHMGLHLAIREQVATDRPAGIAALHAALALRRGDAHAAEHAMIESLAEMLWQAQRTGKAADETVYLEHLRRL
jgi:Domain of unknown function (DUF1841)